MSTSQQIRCLRNTIYPSVFLNIDYWLKTETENTAIIKCKNCRKFKQFFLKEIKGVGDWNLHNFNSRILEIQEQIFTLKFSKTSELPGFSFTRNSANYWIFRGYSEEYSKKLSSSFQKENTKKLYSKYTKNEIREKRTRCVEYYLAKGFSEEESLKLLKERQTTFSMNILLENNDKETAQQIMDNRNSKWQTSLNENNDMKEVNSRKDSASLNFFISKFGENDIARNLYNISCYNLGTATRGKKRALTVRNNISIGKANHFQARRNEEGTDYNGVVYILHFPEHNAVKIGLSGDFEQRSKGLIKDFGDFSIVKLIETDSCFKLEQELHQKFSEHRICLSEGTGRTEFFKEDILEFINT